MSHRKISVATLDETAANEAIKDALKAIQRARQASVLGMEAL
ncbi:hypothetical protein [Duganella vulcania]|nr:hypothetical protein [Duganella vulcania]